MSRARLALIAVVVVGMAGLALSTVVRHTTIMQTLGVLPVYDIAPLGPGQEVCESPIGLAGGIDRVRFQAGTRGKPGVPLDVTIRDPRTRRILGQGHQPGSWIDDGSARNITVGHVPGGRLVATCIRNTGRIRAWIWGDVFAGPTNGRAGAALKLKTTRGTRPTIEPAAASIDGRPIAGDLSMQFVSNKPHSLLSKLPAAFRHAAVFRPRFVGAWTFWVLLVALVVIAPLLLWRAVRSVINESATSPLEPPRDLTVERRELAASGAGPSDS